MLSLVVGVTPSPPLPPKKQRSLLPRIPICIRGGGIRVIKQGCCSGGSHSIERGTKVPPLSLSIHPSSHSYVLKAHLD